MNRQSEVIGAYRLREAKEFRNASFETASWWETIMVEAGSYEVRANFEGDKVYWAHCSLPGTVTGAFFPSSYGGVMIGDSSANDARKVGKPGSYPLTNVYGYGIAWDIISNAHTPWKLNAGYLVVPAGYDNEVSVYRTDNSRFTVQRPAYSIVREAA